MKSRCRFVLAWLSLGSLVLGSLAAAAPAPSAKDLAVSFYVGKILDSRFLGRMGQARSSSLALPDFPDGGQTQACHPQPGACVDAACAFLGSSGCDQLSEIQAVASACRGNQDGDCLKASCKRLGSSGCDQMSEIEEVASACRNNWGSCVEVACDHLGSSGCDQLSEIKAVATSCQGADGECVKSACAHLGSSGCDQLSEIQAVASACGGN